MPRYFFRTDDGDVPVEDRDGVEFPDRDAARRYAQAALADMVRDTLPDGDGRSFTVLVRDEDGATLYSASLSLRGAWHGDPD